MEQQIRVLQLDLPNAVQEIYREWRRGAAVVAVVPAFANTKDDLLKRAEQLGLPPSPGAVAALLTTALQRSGLPATLLDSDLAPPGLPRPPLRVALLGCGTVGGGVLERLLARPDLFHVTGVAVRNLERARLSGVPRHLLGAGPVALAEGEADVVVELLGGREPALSAVARALELGKSVVTANKALLAEEIDSLERLAARSGARLLYSASVGGALPALEAVRQYANARARRIRAVSGVLNGTCNYVLDRLSAGDSFEDAVAAAQTAGFAEADPTLDLDGSDTAQKLALLAREAFGVLPRWDAIPRLGIAGAARRGRTVRLVARAEQTPAGLRASVQPVEVPRSHPFARISGAGNALRIETTDGEVVDLSAQGAGRWPTCESVMADLHELAAVRLIEAEEGAA